MQEETIEEETMIFIVVAILVLGFLGMCAYFQVRNALDMNWGGGKIRRMQRRDSITFDDKARERARRFADEDTGAEDIAKDGLKWVALASLPLMASGLAIIFVEPIVGILMLFLAAVLGLIAWNATVHEDSHQVVEYRKYVVRKKTGNEASLEEMEE